MTAVRVTLKVSRGRNPARWAARSGLAYKPGKRPGRGCESDTRPFQHVEHHPVESDLPVDHRVEDRWCPGERADGPGERTYPLPVTLRHHPGDRVNVDRAARCPVHHHLTEESPLLLQRTLGHGPAAGPGAAGLGQSSRRRERRGGPAGVPVGDTQGLPGPAQQPGKPRLHALRLHGRQRTAGARHMLAAAPLPWAVPVRPVVQPPPPSTARHDRQLAALCEGCCRGPRHGEPAGQPCPGRYRAVTLGLTYPDATESR